MTLDMRERVAKFIICLALAPLLIGVAILVALLAPLLPLVALIAPGVIRVNK